MQAADAAYAGAAGDEPGDSEADTILRRFAYLSADEADMDRGTLGREAAMARAGITFQALDVNGDARVGPKEWATARAIVQDRSDALLARFERHDTDASGTLDREEFVAGERRRLEDAAARAEAAGDGAEAGAPVVFWRYPTTM